jgi:hypothetical protein
VRPGGLLLQRRSTTDWLTQDVLTHFEPEETPDTRQLVDALRAQTPPDLQYLITDGFDNIVLYDNKAETSTVTPIPGNKFKVTLTTRARKVKSDGSGNESPMLLNDYIEIGVFKGEKDHDPPLYLKKEKIIQEKNTFEITVDEKPNSRWHRSLQQTSRPHRRRQHDPRHAAAVRLLAGNSPPETIRARSPLGHMPCYGALLALASPGTRFSIASELLTRLRDSIMPRLPAAGRAEKALFSVPSALGVRQEVFDTPTKRSQFSKPASGLRRGSAALSSDFASSFVCAACGGGSEADRDTTHPWNLRLNETCYFPGHPKRAAQIRVARNRRQE